VSQPLVGQDHPFLRDRRAASSADSAQGRAPSDDSAPSSGINPYDMVVLRPPFPVHTNGWDPTASNSARLSSSTLKG
jgi:hypothetical protein